MSNEIDNMTPIGARRTDLLILISKANTLADAAERLMSGINRDYEGRQALAGTVSEALGGYWNLRNRLVLYPPSAPDPIAEYLRSLEGPKQ